MKTLSVIIANYKSDEYLKNCIDSLHKSIGGDVFFDVVVVNNDKEADLSEAENMPAVKVVHSSENRGFGAASNMGVRNSRGEFLFFLNPDTEVISKNVHELIEDLEQDAGLGMVGAGLVLPDGKRQEWSAGTEVSLMRIIANNLGFIKDRSIWESEGKVLAHWVAGTALIIRRDLFEEVGGFDEGFFMYFEDVDLAKRVRNAGKKVAVYPHFKVLHHGGVSYRNESGKNQKKHYYASQDRYFQKHRGAFESKALKIFRKLHS